MSDELSITVHSSYSDNSIEISENDVPGLLDRFFANFGYSPLEKYFIKYDPSKYVFVCLLDKGFIQPNLFIAINKQNDS